MLPKKIFIYIAFFFFGVVVLSGCMPNLGSSSPKGKPEGEFLKGTVSKGFPPVPLYPKAKIIESFTSDISYGASFETGDELNKVVNFYDDAFSKTGWESTAHKKSDKNYYFDIKNSTYAGTLIVNTAADNVQTAITVSLTKR